MDGVLTKARGAVSRYAERLGEARERIRRLQREEEECIERLRLEKRRLEDAGPGCRGPYEAFECDVYGRS